MKALLPQHPELKTVYEWVLSLFLEKYICTFLIHYFSLMNKIDSMAVQHISTHFSTARLSLFLCINQWLVTNAQWLKTVHVCFSLIYISISG
jgi:hypothetical protein